jgi:hypothetical protein
MVRCSCQNKVLQTRICMLLTRKVDCVVCLNNVRNLLNHAWWGEVKDTVIEENLRNLDYHSNSKDVQEFHREIGSPPCHLCQGTREDFRLSVLY